MNRGRDRGPKRNDRARPAQGAKKPGGFGPKKRDDAKRGFGPKKRDDAKRGFGPKRDHDGPARRPTRPVIRPMMIVRELSPPAPARVGEWLFTTRPGAEIDLVEELTQIEVARPRMAGPALVAAVELPRQRPELAFARQGFPVAAIVPLDDPRAATRLAETLVHTLPIAQGRAARERGRQPFALDAWVPDDDRENPKATVAEALAARVGDAIASIDSGWAALRVTDARAAWSDNGLYAQICVADGTAYLGITAARDAPSLAPGGRLRVHVPKHAPSRAAAKLLEAFAWLDRAPEAGELCVDLGAAPGGWSWVLLERHAKVLAVDPARLDPIIASRRGLTHLRADAFRFEPEEKVDWLVADMAWRPLEAAALYGKWARRGWARMLVANVKLPMRKKAEYLLRVRDILGSSGWQSLRARQLYHDREEVTLAAVRF